MDTLLLFPADIAPSVAHLLNSLPQGFSAGFSAGTSLSLIALRGPGQSGQPLPDDLARNLDAVLDLPHWLYEDHAGLKPLPLGDPAVQSLAQRLDQPWRRIIVFGWALSPVSALVRQHPGQELLLVIEDWSVQSAVFDTPGLQQSPSGPRLHELAELTGAYDRILCLEPDVFAMARSLFADRAVAAPLPIPGYPADLAGQHPPRLRGSAANYTSQDHDGLALFLARQSRIHAQGDPVTGLELSRSAFGFLHDQAQSSGVPVFADPEGPHAPLLEMALSPRGTESRARQALAQGNLTFLLRASATGPDVLLNAAGGRARINQLQADPANWRDFWMRSVEHFTQIQDGNAQSWAGWLSGQPKPPVGRFLFDVEDTKDTGGGAPALIRCHARDPLDPDLCMAVAQLLLDQGRPERALQILVQMLRARDAARGLQRGRAPDAATPGLDVPAALLRALRDLSVFAAGSAEAAGDTADQIRRNRAMVLRQLEAAADAQSGLPADTASEADLYARYCAPAQTGSKTLRPEERNTNSNAPAYTLGMQPTDNGWTSGGHFTAVFARSPAPRDRDMVLLIAGRLSAGTAPAGLSARVEVDGQDQVVHLDHTPDGRFTLPVMLNLPALETTDTPDTRAGFFSVTVTLSGRGGQRPATEITAFDLLRQAELTPATLPLTAQKPPAKPGIPTLPGSEILALMPYRDTPFPGGYEVERSPKAPPVCWISDKASPDLIWTVPEPARAPAGDAICAVVMLQAARTGLAPDDMYLRTGSDSRKARALPGVGKARAYLFDITDLMDGDSARTRMPALELVSPVAAQASDGDQRALSVLLRSVVVVRVPVAALDAVADPVSGPVPDWAIPPVFHPTGQEGSQQMLPVVPAGQPAEPPAEIPILGQRRLDLTGPHLVSPTRVLDLRGTGVEAAHALTVRLGDVPVDPIDIEDLGDDRFVWRGVPVLARPALALASALMVRVQDTSGETGDDLPELSVAQVAFARADTAQPGFELPEGSACPGMSGYYHSGPFMRGFWSGTGGRMRLDLPAGAQAIWVAGDAATGRAALEELRLSCDLTGAALPLNSTTTLHDDGHWQITGHLPAPLAQAAVMSVELVSAGSASDPSGPIGLIRYAGYLNAAAAPSQDDRD